MSVTRPFQPGERLRAAQLNQLSAGNSRFITDVGEPGAYVRQSGQWVQVGPPPITPEQFGAAGDGVTDDSAAIQAGINAVCLTGEPLRLASKTYAIAEPLVIPNPSGICFPLTMVGDVTSSPKNPSAVIKKIAGGSTNDFMMAPAGWVNSTATSYSGMRIEDVVFDGGGIAQNGFVSHVSYPVFHGVRATNCIDTGILLTRTLKNGVLLPDGDTITFIDGGASSCGYGLKIVGVFSDSKLHRSAFVRCNVAIDIPKADGWRITELDTWTDRDPASLGLNYCARIGINAITQVADCTFGNSTINAAAYNIWFDGSFCAGAAERLCIQNGNGVLVTFSNGGKGKFTLSHSKFIEGQSQSPRLWHGTNAATAIVVSHKNIYTLNVGTTPIQYGWVSGNTAGVVYAENDTYQNGSSTTLPIIYDGQQPVGGWRTRDDGTAAHTAAGTLAIVAATPHTLVRNTVMTADRIVSLPEFASDGDRYRIIRTAAATGAFALIFQTFGAVEVGRISAASTMIEVQYSAALAAWIVAKKEAW